MRTILHSDLNNFYATCECLLNPELKDKPVIVCGRVEDRHGIVLAKNYIAKKAGIKTGMTIYQSKKLAPSLVAVEAHHDLYLEYSQKVKEIYKEYSDRVEGFGIDEAWIDVSGCTRFIGSGEDIANEIRERIKKEIGLTVSIGVSYNKIFAKLGSDMKKPDAVTVITKENFKEKVWPLPVEELLFVGRATKTKLNDMGIFTIGGLANFDQQLLKNKFGKCGEKLWAYANGLDISEVKKISELDEIKSVGNSVTYYRDMHEISEVESLFYLLSESVSARMKAYGINQAKTLHINVITKDLEHTSVQGALPFPTNCSKFIADSAVKLFLKHYDVSVGIRGVGVSVCNFVQDEQLMIGEDQCEKDKNLSLDKTIESLRGRFGKNSVNRAVVLTDERLRQICPDGIGISSNSLNKPSQLQ